MANLSTKQSERLSQLDRSAPYLAETDDSVSCQPLRSNLMTVSSTGFPMVGKTAHTGTIRVIENSSVLRGGSNYVAPARVSRVMIIADPGG